VIPVHRRSPYVARCAVRRRVFDDPNERARRVDELAARVEGRQSLWPDDDHADNAKDGGCCETGGGDPSREAPS